MAHKNSSNTQENTPEKEIDLDRLDRLAREAKSLDDDEKKWLLLQKKLQEEGGI